MSKRAETAAEILTAASALRDKLAADVHLSNAQWKAWRDATNRARENKIRRTGPFDRADALLELNSLEVSMRLQGYIAEAKLLLSTAMVRRLDSSDKPHLACKAAIASAKVLEAAATAFRQLKNWLGQDLSDENESRIVEAFKYSKTCRAEVGFMWRFRL